MYRGKRVRQSLNTGSKKLAELALKNTEIQIAKEELNLSSYRRISFEKFCEQFLRWYQTQNSRKSHKDYENLFGSTIIPYFKGRDLGDITQEIVEGYKIERSRKVQLK